ncbi:hypothetical protein PC121_g19496 [Phytophthora cactorum]|nr:hypothetical protein PC120_g19691 [Phytophthora cactorum]KAG3048424.1 hypothetical protein PC121_g19496 [Phytophthora cactorum]
MCSSQASSDDFPRLVGAENFDVWKARVCASLDGKHLLGYVMKPGYNGISDEEDDDSGSDMSDEDDNPKNKPKQISEVDSDAVDYEESDDRLKSPSDSEDNSDASSDSSVKHKNLPTIRPINHRQIRKDRQRRMKKKHQPLNSRERRRQEEKTKEFLMKTMDNTHVQLVKNLAASYEIFTRICEQYEGASFHGDPYLIEHYLMEIKYEEGSDLTKFFLNLENAMKAASEATESLMTEGQKSLHLFHSMPKSWKNDLRIWKGQLKYIPYEDRKQSIEGKVRDIQAQERYTLSKGTTKTSATKNERALVATGFPAQLNRDLNGGDVCSYCDRPRHNIRQCRGLQRDLRDGRVKAGTFLPANVSVTSTTTHNHPYRSSKNRKQRRNNGRGGNNHRNKNSGGSGNNKQGTQS